MDSTPESESSFYRRILRMEIVGPYTIHFWFDDGVEKNIDFEPFLYGEMFGHARNPEYFAEVKLDDGFRIYWPNDGDLYAEQLYDWTEPTEEERARWRARGLPTEPPMHTIWEDVEVASVVEIRKRLGMTQYDFASEIGVSERAVRDWEAGRRKPSGAALMLLRIADQVPDVFPQLARTGYSIGEWRGDPAKRAVIESNWHGQIVRQNRPLPHSRQVWNIKKFAEGVTEGDPYREWREQKNQTNADAMLAIWHEINDEPQP
jgi:transcriptional regulator with XRE-family HTH domain